MQNYRKNVNGITLIALVVTIIILLILAGISIGMLSGDNGILGRAGNAKTQTDIAEEKEIIDLAVLHAAGKSKYGDIDETYFKNELEKNNATAIKKGSKYKVTFSSGRQYTVDQDGNVKEKNPNAMEISDLYDGASTYFGWDVINYAETLPEELQDTEWQLFYAGALDGETEERIYLISKEYVKNTQLPFVERNGIKTEAKPVSQSNSKYKANFGGSTSGVIPQYEASSDISKNLQKYNKDFFKDYTSTKPNIKAVAYMLDTISWRSFATSKKKYADWAIGGPTLELLFKAYNKYKGTEYECDAVSANGYKIKITPNGSFSNYETRIIENDTNIKNNPYSAYTSRHNGKGYWIASPSNGGADVQITIDAEDGTLDNAFYYSDNFCFRPIILLNSNYTLEKTKDINNNDAFKIVEQ